MSSFTLQRSVQTPSRCPSCGYDVVVPGRLLGKFDLAGGCAFRPGGLRALAITGTDVTVDSAFFACASCGHVWSSLSARRLRKIVETKGGRRLRSRLSEA